MEISCRDEVEAQKSFGSAESVQPSSPYIDQMVRLGKLELKTEIPQGKKTSPIPGNGLLQFSHMIMQALSLFHI